MSQLTYLERLAVDLAAGLAGTPEEWRLRHVTYLSRAQNPDGGFSGREGPSDLYYTGFALRSLAALGAVTPEIADRTAGFLRTRLSQKASVVDFFSLLYSCGLIQTFGGPDVLAESAPGWQDRTAAELETFRTPEGGYAKTPGSPAGSTYHTFLVALCYELIERPLPEPDRVRTFIVSRRREDGGYVEIAPMKRSGTNPTAAAVAVLRMLAADVGSAAIERTDDVIDFLVGMASPEGGFRANARAPLADLLSTFTSLWTLHDLGVFDRIEHEAVKTFLHDVEQPEGGFRAGLWDDRADVEYSFYGLGVKALLEA